MNSLFINRQLAESTMANHFTSQPAGYRGNPAHSQLSIHSHKYSTPTSASRTRNTSSSPSTEYFHLYPNTKVVPSRYWLSRKTSPLWLQYLSALLSQSLRDPAASSSPSRLHSSCAILRLKRTATSTTAPSHSSFATCNSRFRPARRDRFLVNGVDKRR